MTLGRAYLINQLRERGLSKRQATRILNALFDSMKEALAEGKEVETPLGTLKVVKHGRGKQRGWFLDRIETLYRKSHTVVLQPPFKDPK